MSREEFTNDEGVLLRRMATTERLERLITSLIAGERLSKDEVNEVCNAAADHISIDRDTQAISDEGRAFDDLIDRGSRGWAALGRRVTRHTVACSH